MPFGYGYIHEAQEWPDLHWNTVKLGEALAEMRYSQGVLHGYMETLGFRLRQEAQLQTITQDVLKTSEIEGERLDMPQVRSSIARRLGIDIGALKPVDRHVDGVVEMMLDATGKYHQPLTAERLYAWHSSLFPAGFNGMSRIRTGAWRDDANGPMQVVSGPIGREKVHFEAPEAPRLQREMKTFLGWFNRETRHHQIAKAAVAHLWFVTIHPFEDGNGRIARAIADMVLARSEASSQRFYSMSAQIREERSAYYSILERTQRGSLDITPWMLWFIGCLHRAIRNAQKTSGSVIRKARFWDSIEPLNVNERQRRVLGRLLDGFDGKLTSSKYAILAKCSQDTALRDLLQLVEQKVLVRDPAGGRSTSYSLAPIQEALSSPGGPLD